MNLLRLIFFYLHYCNLAPKIFLIEVDVDVETILAVATVIVAEGFNGYVLCLNAGVWMIDKQRKVRRVVLIKRL